MTAVVAAHVVAVSAGRWRSIDRDLCYHPFSTGLSLFHSSYTSAGLGFRDSLMVFFAYKHCSAELRREIVRGRTFNRYELIENSTRRSGNNCDLQFANCDIQI